MFRVTIENFQSIKGPITVDVDGLTCITGESNIGKTAIIRAIQALLTNRRGSGFITSGQNRCQVTLEYNGNTVTWTRTKSEAEYVINGTRYAKLKGNVPEELYTLGFAGIDANKQLFWPQIHEQHDKPFALDEGPIATAALLGLNDESRRVIIASKMIQQNISGYKKQEEFISNQIHEQGLKLTSLGDHLGAIEPQYERLKGLEAKKKVLDQKVNDLSRLIQNYQDLVAKVSLRLNDLEEIPDCTQLQELRRVGEQYWKYAKLAKVECNEPPDFDMGLVSKLSSLTRLKHSYAQTVTKSSVVLPEVPPATEYDNLAVSLTDVSKKYASLYITVESLTREDDKINGLALDTEKQLNKLKKLVQVCPFCERPM